VRRRVTLGLAALRATGVGALALLLWNHTTARPDAKGGSRLVLLDASLSMTAHGGRWREALDTARALARGGVIWRFGSRVTGFDTTPPSEGASRLAPALAAAAARGGELVVVSDGAIQDRADLPSDLVRSARMVVLPRAPFFDAFVASVDGPRRVAAGDTVRLRVSYGTAGETAGETAWKRPGKGEGRKATLVVNLSGRRLLSRDVTLPDSGTVSTDLTLPPSPVLHGPFTGSSLSGGWQALEVRLEGVAGDSEPRDDGRVFVLDVSPQPSVVLLAAPPDWETRFLARTLTDVARVPVRSFVALEPGEGRWRDAATLDQRSPGEVARAVAGARLVIAVGDAAALARFTPKGAVLLWPTTRRQDGDWYVQLPGPSPVAGALSGVAWDSLPPATSLAELAPDSATTVVLTARLARRGPPRPAVVLSERGGTRRVVVAAGGLYRWAFRGGASDEAYRALMAGLVDWLLEAGEGRGERFVPVTYEVPNGLPTVWRWAGSGAPRDVVIALEGGERPRVDTLRFDAAGRAELRLPPGAYRYSAVGAGAGSGGGERGLVAVDSNSDEWRPAPAVLTSQPGDPAARLVSVALRDRWWLFALAIAAFAAEWAWRRRQGLP
jgi:hypothetical protein